MGQTLAGMQPPPPHLAVSCAQRPRPGPADRLWLQFPAMGGYVVLGISYATGAPLLGIGLYLLIRGAFPGWWKDWILRPVVRVTKVVARLQGLAAIGLGASIVAIGLSAMVSENIGGLLVVVAMGAYLIGAGIFVYSTWLSRRGASGQTIDLPQQS
jgi:hypothetical protein